MNAVTGVDMTKKKLGLTDYAQLASMAIPEAKFGNVLKFIPKISERLGGLRALRELSNMVHASREPIDKAIFGVGSGKLGSGTYFATKQTRKYANWGGENAYKYAPDLSLSTKAKVLFSKGFYDPTIIDIFSGDAGKIALEKGYIGVRGGSSGVERTLPLMGKKGWGLKDITKYQKFGKGGYAGAGDPVTVAAYGIKKLWQEFTKVDKTKIYDPKTKKFVEQVPMGAMDAPFGPGDLGAFTNSLRFISKFGKNGIEDILNLIQSGKFTDKQIGAGLARRYAEGTKSDNVALIKGIPDYWKYVNTLREKTSGTMFRGMGVGLYSGAKKIIPNNGLPKEINQAYSEISRIYNNHLLNFSEKKSESADILNSLIGHEFIMSPRSWTSDQLMAKRFAENAARSANGKPTGLDPFRLKVNLQNTKVIPISKLFPDLTYAGGEPMNEFESVFGGKFKIDKAGKDGMFLSQIFDNLNTQHFAKGGVARTNSSITYHKQHMNRQARHFAKGGYTGAGDPVTVAGYGIKKLFNFLKTVSGGDTDLIDLFKKKDYAQLASMMIPEAKGLKLASGALEGEKLIESAISSRPGFEAIEKFIQYPKSGYQTWNAKNIASFLDENKLTIPHGNYKWRALSPNDLEQLKNLKVGDIWHPAVPKSFGNYQELLEYINPSDTSRYATKKMGEWSLSHLSQIIPFDEVQGIESLERIGRPTGIGGEGLFGPNVLYRITHIPNPNEKYGSFGFNAFNSWPLQPGKLQKLGGIKRMYGNHQNAFTPKFAKGGYAGGGMPNPMGMGMSWFGNTIAGALTGLMNAVTGVDMTKKKKSLGDYAQLASMAVPEAKIGAGLKFIPKMSSLFLGMPRGVKALEEARNAEKIMEGIHAAIQTSDLKNLPITKLGEQLEATVGRSFPVSGIGGLYKGANGTKEFVKPVTDALSGLSEIRSNKIARDVQGLDTPIQELIKIIDPSDPKGKRTLLALKSAFNPEFANPTGKFTKDQYIRQLVASLLRGDKDLQVANLSGNNLVDSGTSGVFNLASGIRELSTSMPSMKDQAAINLLGVKGGAKKWFAETTASIAKSMTPSEYNDAILAEIKREIPLLEKTVASFNLKDPNEIKAYANMIDRLKAGSKEDWSSFQSMAASVVPAAPKAPTAAAIAKKAEELALRQRQSGHSVGFSDIMFKGQLGGYANGGMVPLPKYSMPSFAVGTSYVPHDMIAQIHKGEAIIPASQNNGTMGSTYNVTVNAGSNANPQDIAKAVTDALKNMESKAKMSGRISQVGNR
jgi:hypothetical protein